MNLVLADTEEFRRVKRRQDRSAPGAAGSLVESEEKRTLGLTIVRGAYIVSLSVESPPPADPSARLGKSAPGGIPSALSAGPGVAKPAGRGAPAPSLAVRYTPLHNVPWNSLLTYVGSCCWRRRWRPSGPTRLPWCSRLPCWSWR